MTTLWSIHTIHIQMFIFLKNAIITIRNVNMAILNIAHMTLWN